VRRRALSAARRIGSSLRTEKRARSSLPPAIASSTSASSEAISRSSCVGFLAEPARLLGARVHLRALAVELELGLAQVLLWRAASAPRAARARRARRPSQQCQSIEESHGFLLGLAFRACA
jgi:hypothetical protein